MAPLRLWEQVPGLGQALAGRCEGACCLKRRGSPGREPRHASRAGRHRCARPWA